MISFDASLICIRALLYLMKAQRATSGGPAIFQCGLEREGYGETHPPEMNTMLVQAVPGVIVARARVLKVYRKRDGGRLYRECLMAE